MPTDAELVARIVQGDSRAWELMVDRYSESLWRLSGKFDLHDTARHDVVQTVWLKLYDRAATIRQPERVIGWLAQVVRNECLNVIRSQSRLVYVDKPLEYDPRMPGPAVSERLERQTERVAVASALERIDARCRELLTLCVVEPELSYEAIGSMLNMPIGSIGPTRRRCLDKLRSQLSGDGIDQEGRDGE